MDRNTSLERRFSLNATHIANPIAESTCLNINNKGSPTIFKWGGTPISPKHRSNSSTCLSNSTKTNQYNATSSRNGNRSISSRYNTTTIDPRIYADVQSKGLASRIVKYHEKGTCLTRSFSVNNLYSKPGQFPVVNLNKSELPKRESFTKPSMTRIAPPEKSMFYGNTLPSVLRSNSVVAMHKSDEEISSENRPILHPPPTENEMAPTRSVLEVLKEISRKRINSDHLDLEDSTKKYCNREMNEQPYVTPNTQQNNKRQREHFNGQTQYVQPPQQLSNYLTTQHSPEHLAKKRLCSYNNDITSSLSSSQIHANKRKLYEQTRGLLQGYSQEEVDHSSTKKLQLQQTDTSSEKCLSTLNNKTLSNYTPADESYNEDNVERNAKAGATLQVNASLPQHDTYAPDIVNSKAKESIKKKKLTLFNKDYDEDKQHKASLQFADNGPSENEDFCGIPFVKPKKSTSVSVAKNPIIERTQKSKLALMLSGLRGDLYHSDEDQVDEAKKVDDKKAPPEKENKTVAELLVQSKPTKTPSVENSNQIKSISNLPGEHVTANNSIVSDSFVKPVLNVLETATGSVSSTSNTQSKQTTALPPYSAAKGELNSVLNTNVCASPKVNITQSPLVGIKLTPPSTTPSAPLINTSIVNTESSAKNLPTLKFNTNPIVSVASSSNSGGFSFNLAPTPVTAPTVTDESQKLNPKIGSLTSTTFNAPTSNCFVVPVKTTTPAFGQTAQLGIQSVAPLTFGSLASSTADTKQPLSKTSDDFDAAKSINFAQISTAAAVATKPFGFGSISSDNTVTTVPSSTNNGFSFGIKNTQTQKPLAAASPFTINSSALTQQSLPKASNSFTFVGATNSSDPTTSAGKTGQISFGETTASTNSFNFGGAATTSASFSFGSNFTATPTQAKAVDTSSKAAQFTFGSNSTASTNTNKNAGFAFESAPTTTTSEKTSTNIFGTSNIQSSTITPSFSFGGTDRPTSMTASSSSNIFGAPPIAADNPQNKTFTFGSSLNSITTQKSEAGGFSFNNANKSNSGGFSFSTNKVSDAGQPLIALPPFRFGSLASNDGGSNTVNNPFQGQSTSTEPFDSSAVLNKTTSPPPFSFTANASNASSHVQTNGNTFAPPTQQNTIAGIGDRPFRRATRRLPKS